MPLLGLLLLAGPVAAADTAPSGSSTPSPDPPSDVPPEWCPGCELEAPPERGDPAAVSAETDASRPFLVKIHADWCATCLMLDFTWGDLRKRISDGARFVVLDVTNEETTARARAEAARLGLTPFFERYRRRTGTIGVLHGSTREVVEVLAGETDLRRYESALAKATR